MEAFDEAYVASVVRKELRSRLREDLWGLIHTLIAAESGWSSKYFQTERALIEAGKMQPDDNLAELIRQEAIEADRAAQAADTRIHWYAQPPRQPARVKQKHNVRGHKPRPAEDVIKVIGTEGWAETDCTDCGDRIYRRQQPPYGWIWAHKPKSWGAVAEA